MLAHANSCMHSDQGRPRNKTGKIRKKVVFMDEITDSMFDKSAKHYQKT